MLPQSTTLNSSGTSALGVTGPTSLVNPANAGQALYNPQAFTNDLGGIATGIGAAFTAQNPYQAMLAPTTQSNYSPAIQQGLNALGQTMGSQNALAQQLIAEGNGQGPNPALAQLNQSTGQNIAAQAALAAGQRGSSGNVGLLARQIGQQGSATQQQAVGQEATQQANQELAAQQAAGSILGTQGSEAGSLFTGAAGAQNSQNSGLVSNYNMAQGINSTAAQNNANAVNKTTGGLLNGAGSLLSMFAKGGKVENPKLANVPETDRLSMKLYPSHLKAIADIYHPTLRMADGGDVASQISAGFNAATAYGSNSPQPPPPPPPPKGMAKGGMAAKGGAVPGKAKVAGNSYKNDTVSAKLSPGEVVIPRSVMQSNDPVSAAAKFVQGLLEKHGSSNEEDDFKQALQKSISKRKK